MKLIDSKGKLFGLINIIDLAVLVLVVLIAAAAFIKLGGEEAITSDNTKEITFVVKARQQLETVAKSIKAGDTLVAGDKYVEGASIADVQYNPAEVTVTTADGKMVVAKDPVRMDIFITVKAKVNTDDAAMKVDTQEVRIGRSYTVKTQTVELGGWVESLSMP